MNIKDQVYPSRFASSLLLDPKLGETRRNNADPKPNRDTGLNNWDPNLPISLMVPRIFACFQNFVFGTMDSGRSNAKEQEETLLLPSWGPSTIKGGPSTLNGGPSTINGGPSTINGCPSAWNGGPSTLNGGPSTINAGPATINGGPSTLNGGPSTLNGGPSTYKWRPFYI